MFVIGQNSAATKNQAIIQLRKRDSIRHRLMLVCCGTLTSLLIAELLLRCFLPTSSPTRWLNPLIGISYLPGTEFQQSAEGHSCVRINSLGFHDDEWPITKPSGTTRIAILGDSFVDAVEVDKENRFSERLQQLLRKSQGETKTTYEVMNFGLRNHGTGQELLVFRNYVSQFKPDIVVLAFFAGNDIRNNSRQLQRDPARPYFNLNSEGRLSLDDSFRSQSTPYWKSFGQQLKKWSRVVQVASHSATLMASYSDRAGKKGLDNSVFAPPTSKSWANAWKVTEHLIRQLNDEVSEQDARLIVMTVTQGEQVSPILSDRKKLLCNLKNGHLFYPEHQIQRICQAADIEVLTLAPVFADAAETDGVFFHGFDNTRFGSGHWNEKGHALASIHLHKLIKKVMQQTTDGQLTHHFSEIQLAQ